VQQQNESKAEVHWDRQAATRKSLLDLGNLQGQSKANQAAREEMKGMVDSHTPSYVRDAVQGKSRYVDLEKARLSLSSEI